MLCYIWFTLCKWKKIKNKLLLFMPANLFNAISFSQNVGVVASYIIQYGNQNDDWCLAVQHCVIGMLYYFRLTPHIHFLFAINVRIGFWGKWNEVLWQPLSPLGKRRKVAQAWLSALSVQTRQQMPRLHSNSWSFRVHCRKAKIAHLSQNSTLWTFIFSLSSSKNLPFLDSWHPRLRFIRMTQYFAFQDNMKIIKYFNKIAQLIYIYIEGSGIGFQPIVHAEYVTWRVYGCHFVIGVCTLLVTISAIYCINGSSRWLQMVCEEPTQTTLYKFF